MSEKPKLADFASGVTRSVKAGVKKGGIPGAPTVPGLPGAAKAAGAVPSLAKGGAQAAAGKSAAARRGISKAREATTDPGRDGKSKAQKAGEAVGSIATETARGAAQGAVAGGVGAVPGAVKGAVVGAGKVTLKSKTGKRTIAVIIGLAIMPLIITMVLVTASVVDVGRAVFDKTGPVAQRVSVNAALATGLTQADITTIMAATATSGVPWQLVAAIYAAQHGPAGNPYRFTTAAGNQSSWADLGTASQIVAAQLVTGLRNQPGWSFGIDIANGAAVSESGQVWWSVTDAHRTGLRDAFVTALTGMPVGDANDSWAAGVYSTALAWRLGQSSANGCTSSSANGTGTSTATPSAGASSTSAPASTGLIATSSTGEKITVTTAMLTNVASMVQVAQNAGLSNQAMLIAAMTMAVESHWQNLASSAVPESLAFPNDGVVAGDHDSINAFQQRAYSGAWGTPAQLMNQTYAASMFFGLSPPGAPANHARGLTQINGWETMDPGVAAQTVQVSAFPDRYAQWQQAAADMIVAAAGIQVPGNCAVIPGSTDASNTYGPYWASYGNPEGADPWSFYWGECVSYAAYMVRTTTKYTDFTNNFRGQHFGNAYQWVAAARAAGLVVDTTPAVGSIAVRANINNGHVAYVTKVYQNGNIDVSEYNHAGKHMFGTRTDFSPFTTASPNNQFQWFIHFEQ